MELNTFNSPNFCTSAQDLTNAKQLLSYYMVATKEKKKYIERHYNTILGNKNITIF